MNQMRNIIQNIIFLPMMILFLGFIYFITTIRWIVFGTETDREKAGYEPR